MGPPDTTTRVSALKAVEIREGGSGIRKKKKQAKAKPDRPSYREDFFSTGSVGTFCSWGERGRLRRSPEGGKVDS